MVERLHRTLKAALMAKCNDNNWTTNLPWILLGLRATPKEGSNTTAAEMTYGDNLQVPGDFFATPGNTKIQDIRHEIKKYVPCRPSYKNTRKTYLPPDLHKASHVFLCIDAQKAPLTPPYISPYQVQQVQQRRQKIYQIIIRGKPEWVSIDRLKPAYTSTENQQETLSFRYSRAGCPYASQLFLRGEHCVELVNADTKTQIAIADTMSFISSLLTKCIMYYYYCYGPEEIFKSPTLADISWRSSGSSSIPVTSSLMPSKPARTGRKQYSWQNPPKKDICMHIRIINPWECRKEKKQMTFKSQGSINCPHKTNDEVASLNSYVTRAPAVLSVEETSSLVARKRFLPTEYSALSLIDNFRKRWMAFKGFVSLLVIRLIMILGIFGGIMKISRCEGKSRIGNSMECAPRESLGNVGILSLFSNFLEYLNTILRFRKELWNNMIGNLVCKRNKKGTRKRERIWSFASRPTLELCNLRLGNAVQETFRLRSGNTVETFMGTKHFPICLCLFLDLCASCWGQLGLFKENLRIRIKVKAIYVNIYLFIYVFCCALLSCKLAAYPGAFAIKMYTLVYFSPKVNLLERKYHHKNQSINLIGLAHVGKTYSRNRLFLGPNRPYWRELRPLVTPWVKSIKEGTDPWRNQNWALLSQCPGKLPSSLSLSSPSLALFCTSVLYYNYLLVKGFTVTGKLVPNYSKLSLFYLFIPPPILPKGQLHYRSVG